MKRIYIPTASSDDWQRFLAEPTKQWRPGYSAKELADCWERADGFPAAVQAVFKDSSEPALRELTLLLAIPEFKVDLPPAGGRPSQNDLFVLARAGDGQLAVIMVEGKVAEAFGPMLSYWWKDGTSGKQERFDFLCRTLGLPNELPPEIRYQLLHRTASAILTAREFRATYAILLVHSFSAEHAWLADYQAFLALMGASGAVGKLVEIPGHKKPRLYAGWVADKPQV
jgi:hypothetical protein